MTTRQKAVAATVIVLAGCAFEFVAAELPFYVPYYVYIAGALVLLLLAAPAWKQARQRDLTALFMFAALIFSLLYFCPTTSRKRFLRRFAGVSVGMEIGVADGLLAEYRVTGPDGERFGQIAYMHDLVGSCNADIGILFFKDGRVAAKEFLPD